MQRCAFFHHRHRWLGNIWFGHCHALHRKSTVDNRHSQAVLKCAILRRELQLEDKRFEVDYYIPSKKHFKEIVEDQLYRKLRHIYLHDGGERYLQQLYKNPKDPKKPLDQHSYVKRDTNH